MWPWAAELCWDIVLTKTVKYKKKEKKNSWKVKIQCWKHTNFSAFEWRTVKMMFAGVAHLLDGCRFVEEYWTGGLRVEIQQGSGPPPPIVLIGDQEMYSGLKWRWHLLPNSSCLNYPAADKGWSFNKSWEGKIAGWRTLMKCLGAYFELEIRT